MALMTLTLRSTKHPKIALNTRQIIGIQDMGSYCHLTTTGARGDGVLAFNVEEDWNTVVGLFQEAERRE